MSTRKPSKQRKANANAPLHVKRKRIRARCIDPAFPTVRNVTVCVGDRVQVHRGDWGNPGHDKAEGGKRLGADRGKLGVEGLVIGVDGKKGKVFVEGVSQPKSDGKEEGIAIHASNLVVIKVNDGDLIRIKKLESREGVDE
jgi:ribosomal protein L24